MSEVTKLAEDYCKEQFYFYGLNSEEYKQESENVTGHFMAGYNAAQDEVDHHKAVSQGCKDEMHAMHRRLNELLAEIKELKESRIFADNNYIRLIENLQTELKHVKTEIA